MKWRMYRGMIACLLLGFLALAISPLSARAASRSSPPNFAAIDSYGGSQMLGVGIPGLALGIVHGDQVIHLRGFGVADPSGRAVTPQTPFIIGSTSKSFTALAVMQLVEAGKLDLNTPVQHYIPWFRVADPLASAHITVRHLLNQTSGIPSAAGLAPLTGNSDATLEQRVRELSTVVLTKPVGTTYQYSSANYAVLGLLIQSVSGQSYEDYIQQHIFAPLTMRHSYTSSRRYHESGPGAPGFAKDQGRYRERGLNPTYGRSRLTRCRQND